VNTDVDHIHILASIPPKFSVSEVIKIIKAKTGQKTRIFHFFMEYCPLLGLARPEHQLVLSQLKCRRETRQRHSERSEAEPRSLF